MTSLESSAPAPRSHSFPWLQLLLLVATLISTMVAGSLLAYQGLFGRTLPAPVYGFLFAGALLLILGVHELGHYFAAQWHGVDATLPYFIPVPIGIGTFGAFIRMRSALHNRCVLFDIGLAGPLAGLVVALPLFVVGLFLAPVQQHPSIYGNGLLPQALIFAVEKLRGLPAGYHLMPHPISFAAYLGLFITAVNLLPAGQLDGGHVAYALLGRRSLALAVLTVLALTLMGVLTRWASWFIWASIILLMGLRHPPTLADQLSPGPVRWLLGVVGFFFLLLLFATNPLPVFR